MTRNWWLTLGAVVLAAATVGTTVKAAPVDGTTYLTFSNPVAIPGATLAAGTYIFEQVNSDSSLDVVRVLSRDRSRVYLTQLTRAIERPANMKNTEGVMLGEADAGSPPPVVAWFPRGEMYGQEFVYGNH